MRCQQLQKWCKKGVVKDLRERERLKIRGSRLYSRESVSSKILLVKKTTANFLFYTLGIRYLCIEDRISDTRPKFAL